LAPFFQTQAAEANPLVVHRFEGLLYGNLNLMALLLSVLTGVDINRQQPSCFITTFTRLLEADFRIGSEGHALLHPFPVIAEKPKLPTGFGDAE